MPIVVIFDVQRRVKLRLVTLADQHLLAPQVHDVVVDVLQAREAQLFASELSMLATPPLVRIYLRS